MGVSLFRRGCNGLNSEGKIVNLNPNPKNFKIVEILEFENYTYAEINYPECNNYEGNKVLVFPGWVANQLRNASSIDPHFQKSGLSPIARFEPSPLGKTLALKLAES